MRGRPRRNEDEYEVVFERKAGKNTVKDGWDPMQEWRRKKPLKVNAETAHSRPCYGGFGGGLDW